MRRLASVPWYPVALAGVIVFAAYLDADVSIHAALRPFLLVAAAAALLTAVSVKVLGFTRGPVLVTCLILLVRSGDPFHAGVATLLVVLVGIAWIVARRILPAVSVLRDPNRLLNSMTLVLVASTLLTAAITGTLGRIDLQHGRSFESASVVESVEQPRDPDIYLILLDGYPRGDTLERLFGFENTPFLSELEDRGFEVADSSRSNYMYTAVSFTSVLHMEYVQEMPGAVGTGTPYGASLRTLINHNPVWDRLRSRGYQIAASQAPWETVAMRGADLFCGNQVNDFELYLLRTTLVGPVVNAINPGFKGDQHRGVINQAFDCLRKISAPTTSPKFVFTHVGGPHLPVVFTRSGGAADTDVFGDTTQEMHVTDKRFASAYTDEVEYLNSRVLEAVDLLAQRPDAPIVILMSDHGSESRLDWADSSRSDLQERFTNFFAARTPSRPATFPTDITPVNLFPLLFDAYFDERIPLREARFFLSPIRNKLDFTEIPDPAPPATAPL